MLLTLLTVLIGIVSLIIFYKAVKMLWHNSWFTGFIRGLLGLSILACSCLVALLAFDIYSYKQILQEQVVATVSFTYIEPQHFDALVVDKEGRQVHYDLHGDQWQLDARIVKWKGYLASLAVKPAYRLERIGGRYYDLEQETSGKRSVHAIGQSYYGVDTWNLLNKQAHWFPFVDTSYGSATYLPMKDKALFQVTLSNSGLLARPLNDSARDALAELN